MKEFNVITKYGTYRGCTYSKNQYNNGHIAIQLYCEDGPLATLTVNVNGIENYPENYSCIDTNNCPWGKDLIKMLELGEWTGVYLRSGYCMYPVYKFLI